MNEIIRGIVFCVVGILHLWLVKALHNDGKAYGLKLLIAILYAVVGIIFLWKAIYGH